ncbi:MAG: hypothetical protein HY940_07735 [Gammaproteobacteria bacterium]|nr:hypothetical protein [Gammaproteobacteria bacterium]
MKKILGASLALALAAVSFQAEAVNIRTSTSANISIPTGARVTAAVPAPTTPVVTVNTPTNAVVITNTGWVGYSRVRSYSVNRYVR